MDVKQVVKTITAETTADTSINDLLQLLSAFAYMNDFPMIYRVRLTVKYTDDSEMFPIFYAGDESNDEIHAFKEVRPEDLYSVGGLVHFIQVCNEMNRNTYAYAFKILGKEPIFVQVIGGGNL